MITQVQGARQPRKIKAWFHGYTYNATLGSRTQLTDTIKNGYLMAIDPEAFEDGFAAATANADYPSRGTPTNTYPTDATYKAQMILNGYGNDRPYIQITKPTSGMSGRLLAGVITGLTTDLVGTKLAGNGGYIGGVWLTLIVAGPARAYTKANSSRGTTLGADLSASGTDLYALAAIDTTTATNNQLVAAKSLVTHDTSTTAAFSEVWIGGPAILCEL